jgi:hypothetical protein
LLISASNPAAPPRICPGEPARMEGPSYTKSTPWLMVRLNPSAGWGKGGPTTWQVASPAPVLNPNVLLAQGALFVTSAGGITPIPTPPPFAVIATRSPVAVSLKPVMVATPPVHNPDPVSINPIVPGHPPVLRIAVRLAEAIPTSGFTAVEDTSKLTPVENAPVEATPAELIPIATLVMRR